MKHKTDAGPGLVVALGSPGEDSGSATGDPARPTPDGDPNALSDAANTDTVPLNLLSMPDDQEQMQPPGVGDVVNYQVTGKVVAIEGDMAKVERQSINGQELPGQDDEDNDNESPQDANQSQDDDEGQSLRNDAAGIGMLSAILIALFLWFGPSAHAQSVGPYAVMPGIRTILPNAPVANNAPGATIGSITLTNNNGNPQILGGNSQLVNFYTDGSIGFFPNGGNGGFYTGSDGHANFGGAHNEIFFDSGDAGIWTQGGSGSELDDGSGNMTVENSLTVNGKLTVNGGTDPPYVLLDTNSEAAIKGEVEYEVPTNKFTGAALFWNLSRHALEVYIASEDKFYDINGNVLATNIAPTVFTPFHAVLQTVTTLTNGVSK